jgi:hypothetical protein
MRSHWLVLTIGFAVVAGLTACGGNSIAPTPTPTPNPPGPTTLAGTWSGAVGVSPDDGRSLGVIWDAGRIGQGLSGKSTISTAASAPVRVTFDGTLTANRDGDQFMLTYVSDAVSVGGSSCAMSATGTARVDGFTLVGNLAVSYTSCDALGLQPPASTYLQLLKKQD